MEKVNALLQSLVNTNAFSVLTWCNPIGLGCKTEGHKFSPQNLKLELMIGGGTGGIKNLMMEVDEQTTECSKEAT